MHDQERRQQSQEELEPRLQNRRVSRSSGDQHEQRLQDRQVRDPLRRQQESICETVRPMAMVLISLAGLEYGIGLLD